MENWNTGRIIGFVEIFSLRLSIHFTISFLWFLVHEDRSSGETSWLATIDPCFVIMKRKIARKKERKSDKQVKHRQKLITNCRWAPPMVLLLFGFVLGVTARVRTAVEVINLHLLPIKTNSSRFNGSSCNSTASS